MTTSTNMIAVSGNYCTNTPNMNTTFKIIGTTIYDKNTRNNFFIKKINQLFRAAISMTITLALTETVTISEAVARVNTKTRALAQTVTISEALARVDTKTRALAQTVTISEAVTRVNTKT